MKTLTDRLREIVAREPWNLDDLAEWADWFLYWFEPDEDSRNDEYVNRWKEAAERVAQHVGQLKPLVGPYWHEPDLPALPDRPDGELHGIGFTYDEDRDDRVLVAIDTLKDTPGLVALAEHEGVLTVYVREPIAQTSVTVCEDVWVIEQVVPY